MKVKIEVPKLVETLSKLAQLGSAAIPKELSRALYQELEKVAARAKDEFVPVDTGNLRNTIHVKSAYGAGERVYVSGTEVSGEIVAGGPAADYAFKVHENMSPAVRWKKPGTGPKYLERPLLEAVPQIDKALAEAVERAAASLFK